MAGILDRDHLVDNLVDRVEVLTRRVAALERLFPGRPGEAADRLAFYRPEDGSLRAPAFERILYQNRARVYQSTQTIAHDTVTVVQFGVVDYDARGEWDTANYRYTAELDGYFAIVASAMFDATGEFAGAEYAWLAVYLNGVQHVILDRQDQLDCSSGSTYPHLHGSSQMHLATGDYIDIRVYQYSGASLDLSSNPNVCWMAVHCLS